MENRWIRLVLSTAIGLVLFAGQPGVPAEPVFASVAWNSQQPAASSTSSPTSPTATQAKISPGTLVQVEMTSDVDVKKAHAGDIFRTKLWQDVRSGDKIILPQNTVLVGHVVDAQPRTKTTAESKLTIAFDKAVLKDGSELPLHGVVERVQLTPIAVAAGAGTNTPSYNPGLNPGSTTNVAMPNQLPSPGQGGVQDKNQLPTPGPTNIRDTSILIQRDASGTLTVLSSAAKADVKLKHYATLDVRITHTGE